jgi:6-phosphogluconolactonase
MRIQNERGSWQIFLLLACSVVLRAQGNFVFTNNDPIFKWLGPNTINGFAVQKDGTLADVLGSSFRTGGIGGGGGFIASNRIITVGQFLYASNQVTNDVSGFIIDRETGTLTTISGSPYPTGGTTADGFSLAATPDSRFLYAANDGSATIRMFQIDGNNGELTSIGDPIFTGGAGANGMKVSPDGRWLALALTRASFHGLIAMFSIDPKEGTLTPVPGSPFPVRPFGGPDGAAAGVDINCSSDKLFVAEAGRNTTLIDVFSIDSNTGSLAPIEGSPFMPGVGFNANVVLLSPDDSLLFASNQGVGTPETANSITVFTVASGGSLTVVPGSPFDTGGGTVPSGMATDPAGALLFVTKFDTLKISERGVAVLSIGSDGTLSLVPSSPFRTSPGTLLSLAAYPRKTCPSKDN